MIPIHIIKKITAGIIKYKLELSPHRSATGTISLPVAPAEKLFKNGKLILVRQTDNDKILRSIVMILMLSHLISPFLYKRIDQEKKHKGKINEAIPKDWYKISAKYAPEYPNKLLGYLGVTTLKEGSLAL